MMIGVLYIADIPWNLHLRFKVKRTDVWGLTRKSQLVITFEYYKEGFNFEFIKYIIIARMLYIRYIYIYIYISVDDQVDIL